MIAHGPRPIHAKFILPALTEATGPHWRPIKYSLFPPLGLATLAAFGHRGLGKVLILTISAMFLTTLWLLYLQAFVIRHFCQFCLLSALVSTTLTILIIAAHYQNRDRTGVPARATRVGCWMRPDH